MADSQVVDSRAHTFQILTKRPERMLEYLSPDNPRYTARKVFDITRGEAGKFDCDIYWPLPNVQLGVSVEDQETADERIPLLLQTPAAVRFISAEPLLGPIDLDCWEESGCPRGWLDERNSIDWVIVGGESGPKARPMHPDWARSLRDQCVAAGVPFFFKQWGEWVPHDSTLLKPWDIEKAKMIDCDGDVHAWTSTDGRRDPHKPEEWAGVFRVGKKKAGATLDGREWREYPEAT